MAIPLTLKVFKGGTLVSAKDFERDIIKIGRLSSVHLRLEDEKVSRVHSVLEASADGTLSIPNRMHCLACGCTTCQVVTTLRSAVVGPRPFDYLTRFGHRNFP